MSKPGWLIIGDENTHPIDELYVCLSVNAEGNEGILAELRTNKWGDSWVPLVTTEQRHIPLFEKMIRELGPTLAPGTRVRLVTFKRGDERILWGQQ